MLDWIKSHTTKNRKDSGKYNFHVKSQPEILDSSTTLTLTTYTNSSQNGTIPCRYRWSIIKNGLTIEVPQFKGSSFKCEPSDIGSLIQAEIISTDSEYGGTAVIQFGPVKLDVSLKKQIQIALSSGCATMPVCLLNNGQEKQCQIRLFQDVIKLNHAYSQTNYTFDYSIFQPRIQCISKDSSRVIIVFNEKYESELKRFTKRLFEQPTKDMTSSVKSNQSIHLTNSQTNKLDIKFMNRNSRDIFLFTLKAFNAKKQLRSSTIINKIQNIDFNNQQTFDYILEIQGLKSELVKMDYVIKRVHQEKLRYLEEIHKLQKQIEQIIVTYTRIVEQKFQNQAELSRDYSILSAKRDEIVSKKYKNLESENNHLNSRINTLTKEIDTIRFKPINNPMAQSVQPFTPQSNYNTVQKVHFNYELNHSPFTKKKSYQENSNVIGNILDQLGQSRLSMISSIKQDPQIKYKLERTQKQKQQLQKKLEKSFHKIDNLEKELFQKQQLLRNDQKMSNSAIHFTYKGGNDSMINYLPSPLSVSTVFDRQKQDLTNQNKQLKKSNQFLMRQKRKLIDELKSSRKLSPICKIGNRGQIFDNSLHFLRTQKKDSSVSQKQKDLIEQLSRRQSQLKLLKMQNQELKKANQKLKKALQSAKSGQHNQKLQKKIRELEQQLQMYRKNADALNRSQQLSMEMDNYNEQQITMLKQHNQFLTSQNQKLAKACQKYMAEAKQSNKLRMEIIKLKQKVNELQMLNGSTLMIQNHY